VSAGFAAQFNVRSAMEIKAVKTEAEIGAVLGEIGRLIGRRSPAAAQEGRLELSYLPVVSSGRHIRRRSLPRSGRFCI